jgi:hypothetical protein
MPKVSYPLSPQHPLIKISVLIALSDWCDFRNQLWGQGLEHFQAQYIETRAIQLDGNAVNFKVMKVRKPFGLKLKGMLVRDEWEIAWTHAMKAYDKGMSSMILIGQPGIGVSESFMFPFTVRLRIPRSRQNSFSLLHACDACGPWFTNFVSKRS